MDTYGSDEGFDTYDLNHDGVVDQSEAASSRDRCTQFCSALVCQGGRLCCIPCNPTGYTACPCATPPGTVADDLEEQESGVYRDHVYERMDNRVWGAFHDRDREEAFRDLQRVNSVPGKEELKQWWLQMIAAQLLIRSLPGSYRSRQRSIQIARVYLRNIKNT